MVTRRKAALGGIAVVAAAMAGAPVLAADQVVKIGINLSLTGADAEGAIRVVMFTRNALCAFASPSAALTTANFIDRLLDPAVKLGTSTPKADPGGDYTWLMFHTP